MDSENLYMRYSSTSMVLGVGKIMLQINFRKLLILNNILYIAGIKAMFVFWKIISRKPLSKLSCVCLPLEKLVNGKHFLVNKKHFSVKNFFCLVSRKVFSLVAVFVFRKVVSGKALSKLSCVCLPLEKLVNRKHFSVKGKFGMVFRKVFS